MKAWAAALRGPFGRVLDLVKDVPLTCRDSKIAAVSATPILARRFGDEEDSRHRRGVLSISVTTTFSEVLGSLPEERDILQC